MVIFNLFLVFMYSINYVYYANIIYYIILLKETVRKRGKINFIANSTVNLFMLMFFVWITFTTFGYAIFINNFDVRTVVQYLFTLQYIVLVLSINIDFERVERWTYRFSMVMAVTIVIVAVYIMFQTQFFSLRVLYNNEFAYKLFPGWPNSTPIPLLISFYVASKNRKKIIYKIVLFFALILTTSRGAILGVLIIIGYYTLTKIKKSKKSLKFILPSLLIVTFGALYWIFDNSESISMLLRSYDRVDIFKTTMEYIKLNPIFGYGGNTIEQLGNVKINHEPLKNWGHTHNWVLEITLRYGIVGLSLFVGFMLSLWVSIKNKDQKFMFALFIFLALFQTFMRDFVFIFYLTYLSRNFEKNT